jgi:hypothetical protein
VVLVRATVGDPNVRGDQPLLEVFEDPTFGWRRRVRGALDIIDAPGGHTSMLQGMNLARLLRALEPYLAAR